MILELKGMYDMNYKDIKEFCFGEDVQVTFLHV